MTSVELVTYGLAGLTIFGQAVVVILLGFLISSKSIPAWWQHVALPAAFIVAFISMCGSLYFSEVAKYPPCELCWFQRIFMYPQVILLGLALIRKERLIAPYCLFLSALGAVIAGYHYAIQLGAQPLISCTSNVPCGQAVVMTYGYITIPLMALTAFVLLCEAMIIVLLARPAMSAA